jgi:hypothetical protein
MGSSSPAQIRAKLLNHYQHAAGAFARSSVYQRAVSRGFPGYPSGLMLLESDRIATLNFAAVQHRGVDTNVYLVMLRRRA